MDYPRCGFDVCCLCDYFSDLSVLYFRQIRNRVSLFFLYEKVCDTAFNLTSDHSSVLLPKADAGKKFH